MPADITAVVFRAIMIIGLTSLPGFVGGLLAIVNQDFLQRLSHMKLNFLVPCLVFSNIGARLSPARVMHSWPVLVWSCLQIVLGVAVAKLLTLAYSKQPWARTHNKQNMAPLLIVAVAFQNVLSFNMPLLETLCAEDMFPEHGEHCYADGVMLFFGYQLPWDIGLWGFGYTSVLALGGSEHGSEDGTEDADCTVYGEVCTEEAPAAKPVRRVVQTTWLSSPRIFVSRAVSLLNPVLLAMILSLFVGFCPPLQKAFFVRGGSLSFIGDGAARIAKATPVVGLQILSGTLGCLVGDMWKTLREPQKVADDCGSACSSTVIDTGMQRGKFLDHETLSWVGAAIAGKLVCVPALCMLLTTFMQSYAEQEQGFGEIAFPISFLESLWPSGHRLLRAIVLLQWSAPSCLSLIILCHRACLGERIARAVATMYLAMYPLAIATSTVWLTLGLQQL
jgi:predicted permease